MKTIVFLLCVLFVSTSFSMDIPKECFKEERQLIRKLSRQYGEPISFEVDESITVQFASRIFIIYGDEIWKEFALNDGEWEDVSSEQKRLEAFVFDFNDKEPRIEIQPVNGVPSWTLHYKDSFYDPTIQAMIYTSGKIMVAVGEDYAFYHDGSGTYWFNTDLCEIRVE